MSGQDWLLTAGVVLAVLLAAEVALQVFAVWVSRPLFENSPAFNLAPAAPDPSAAPVAIPGPDGRTLAAAVFPPTDPDRDGPPRGVVLFCPETGGTRWFAPRYLDGVRAAGYAVVGFDFRGTGESDPEPGFASAHWLAAREVDDAVAALDWTRDRPGWAGLPVFVYGVSRGACAALAAAARRPVDGVVTDGAFSLDRLMTGFARKWAQLFVPGWFAALIPDWHLRQSMTLTRRVSELLRGVRFHNFERDARRLRGTPALLIAGGRDGYVNPDQSRQIARRLGPSAAVWVVPKAKHNEAREIAGDEYDARIVAFLERCGGESAPP